MLFNKNIIKKWLEVEDGEVAEVIDVRMQVEITAGDSYEDLRSVLHQRLDKRFSEMFEAELGLMPKRVEEGEKWVQQGLFADHLDINFNDLISGIDQEGEQDG